MRKAPYKPGDQVRSLHSLSGAGTVLAVVPVVRVTALTDGRWRVECERTGDALFPTVSHTVGSDGRDMHGYCEPTR